MYYYLFMKLSGLLKVIREIITAYGGWKVGEYLTSKHTKNKDTISTGAWAGMAIAEIISFASDLKLEPEPSKENEINYRTDHAAKIKAESKQKSSLEL